LDRRTEIFRWAFFGVLMPLLPILFTGSAVAILGGSLDDWKLLGRGELLLVATVLTGIAIGDLFVLLRPAEALRELPAQVQLASSILVIAVTSYLFAFPQIADISSHAGVEPLRLERSEYLLANYACLAIALLLGLATVIRTGARA
jgi:hypothetical protein